MTEGTIAKWMKQPGDQVQKGDVLLEIETDKATMELEAYESGVVEKVLVSEGQTVPIGQPIMLIGDGSGQETGDRRQETGGGGAASDAPTAPASGEGSQGQAAPTAPEAPGGDAPAQPAAKGAARSGAASDAPTGEAPKQGQAPADPQRSYGYGFPDGDTALAPGGGATAPVGASLAAPAEAALPAEAAPSAEAAPPPRLPPPPRPPLPRRPTARSGHPRWPGRSRGSWGSTWHRCRAAALAAE